MGRWARHAGVPFLSTLLCACEPGLVPAESQRALLAGGDFVVGSATLCMDGEGIACAADRAAHPVRLSPFLLDKTEVTRLQYAACVVAGACSAAAAPAFDADHPSDPVTVDAPAAARRYCAWKSARLPSEVEFEYAARAGAGGTLHAYPWGDAPPTCDRLAFAGCPATAARPVGSTPGDVSAAGVFDLAGSVPEWVEDRYVAPVGCLDRMAYGDLCWGRASTCPDDRCAADGALCVKGCLPPVEDAGETPTSQVTSRPVCPAAADGDMTRVLVNPVFRSPLELGVVRGGGPHDRACALAGYTRRHASPGRFSAGFRCARSSDPTRAPTPPTSYRFTLAGCPSDDYPVRVTLVNAGGEAVSFTADLFPSPGVPPRTLVASAGTVDLVPCGGVTVLRPDAGAALTVTISDARSCASGVRTIDLTQGGDVPSVGSDTIRITLGAACSPGM